MIIIIITTTIIQSVIIYLSKNAFLIIPGLWLDRPKYLVGSTKIIDTINQIL